MDTASGAFMASDTTAFAPGYPEAAQSSWRAVAIARDRCVSEWAQWDL